MRMEGCIALLLTLPVATACDLVGPDDADGQALSEAGSLVFTWPNPGTESTSASAGAEPSDDSTIDEVDLLGRPLQEIFDERTDTGFSGSQAWAGGEHKYIGNVGAVETTARLYFEDRELVEQVAREQQYTPFLLDLGRKKFIWAFAPISSDHECGLLIRGSSDHSASWQFFQGSGTSTWGRAVRTSVAEHKKQAPCVRETLEPWGGGLQGSTCYYRVTYDLDTGEILSAELLYCTVATEEYT